MEVQFEGNSSEEEVGALCDGAVNCGSSTVRAEHGMRAVLKFFSEMTRAKMLQYKTTRARKNQCGVRVV